MAAAYGRASSFAEARVWKFANRFPSRAGKVPACHSGAQRMRINRSCPSGIGRYLYTYRVWGRLLYNPDAEPDTWQRQLREDFHSAAQPVESALAHSSRICRCHHSSWSVAANNNYWPEMYTNMSIVDPAGKHPYSDTPTREALRRSEPVRPGLSPASTTLRRVVRWERSAKYSPLEVAAWLEELAANSAKQLALANRKLVRSRT